MNSDGSSVVTDTLSRVRDHPFHGHACHLQKEGAKESDNPVVAVGALLLDRYRTNQ